jgi:hypothetical protein
MHLDEAVSGRRGLFKSCPRYTRGPAKAESSLIPVYLSTWLQAPHRARCGRIVAKRERIVSSDFGWQMHRGKVS